MTKILHIDASGRHEGSISRKLSNQVVKAIGGGEATYRDIGQGLPFVDDTMIGAYFTAPEERSEAQKQAVALSDELVKELQEHDTYVIGLPIYNFSMPAAFKAWCDLIARVGMTFKYTETGPIGLLGNKKAYIVIASGGTGIGSDLDFLTPWLKHYLGFIGITDMEIVDAAGLGADRDKVMQKAEAQIETIKAA